MSFQVFKTNMSLWMQTPDKLATGNAESYEDFADKLTKEYDLAVKSGFQTVNLVRAQKGNTELMKSQVIIACLNSLNKTEGQHNFIDDLGKAIIGYWTGFQLLPPIPPLIPAVGAIYNIATVSGFCSSPGTWGPIGPIPPVSDSDVFLDRLISSMQTHLTTLQFVYFTLSIYPGPPAPPAPGTLVGFGYTIPPSTPTLGQLALQLVQELIYRTAFDNSDTLTEEEKKQIRQEKAQADNMINDTTQTPQGKELAKEFSNRAAEMLLTGKHDSTPVYFSEEELKAIEELQPEEFNCEAGARIIEAARKDIGICEFNNKNYGGFGPGEQRNESGRIDEMVASTGLDNEGQVKKTGSGFFWCAAATTQWWKEAGIELPPTLRASCNGWMSWAKEKGYFSNIPKQGAAILYRGSRKPGAVHIGVVESIVSGVGVNTIEGNTGGGAAFADNGGGCYRKLAKWSKGNIIGFVNPPDCL